MLRKGLAQNIPDVGAVRFFARTLKAGFCVWDIDHLSHQNGGHPVEFSGKTKMLQHTVKAIENFVNILDKKNSAIARPVIRRSNKILQ